MILREAHGGSDNPTDPTQVEPMMTKVVQNNATHAANVIQQLKDNQEPPAKDEQNPDDTAEDARDTDAEEREKPKRARDASLDSVCVGSSAKRARVDITG
jgi:hypothetical protein